MRVERSFETFMAIYVHSYTAGLLALPTSHACVCVILPPISRPGNLYTAHQSRLIIPLNGHQWNPLSVLLVFLNPTMTLPFGRLHSHRARPQTSNSRKNGRGVRAGADPSPDVESSMFGKSCSRRRIRCFHKQLCTQCNHPAFTYGNQN